MYIIIIITHTKHQQVLLLVQATFTCHTQTTEKYFLGYSPTHTKHRKILLLAQFVFTCHLHKTSHQEVQSMHLHLQVPCFAYISSIYTVLHTFHLHTLFFIDFSEIGAPPTDKGEVFSWWARVEPWNRQWKWKQQHILRLSTENAWATKVTH